MATTTNGNGHDYMIVNEASDDLAGATVCWSLTGDVNRTAFAEQLLAVSLEKHTPEPHSPEVALRRAATVLRSKRRLIRPLKKGAWAVVDEQVQTSGGELGVTLKHWTGPTITLDKIGRPKLTNATAEEAKLVKDAYEYQLDALTTEDLSQWLIAQVERLGGVAMRRSGGFYYLPPRSMPEWRRIMSAVTGAHEGHAMYKVPTVRMTKDGARLILDSVKAEIEAEILSIGQEVISGELGVLALETRANRTDRLIAKATEYEVLLGSQLTHTQQALDKLRADVVAAKLAAEADEEAV